LFHRVNVNDEKMVPRTTKKNICFSCHNISARKILYTVCFEGKKTEIMEKQNLQDWFLCTEVFEALEIKRVNAWSRKNVFSNHSVLITLAQVGKFESEDDIPVVDGGCGIPTRGSGMCPPDL